jgi:hypothetical protein
VYYLKTVLQIESFFIYTTHIYKESWNLGTEGAHRV